MILQITAFTPPPPSSSGNGMDIGTKCTAHCLWSTLLVLVLCHSRVFDRQFNEHNWQLRIHTDRPNKMCKSESKQAKTALGLGRSYSFQIFSRPKDKAGFFFYCICYSAKMFVEGGWFSVSGSTVHKGKFISVLQKSRLKGTTWYICCVWGQRNMINIFT